MEKNLPIVVGETSDNRLKDFEKIPLQFTIMWRNYALIRSIDPFSVAGQNVHTAPE